MGITASTPTSNGGVCPGMGVWRGSGDMTCAVSGIYVPVSVLLSGVIRPNNEYGEVSHYWRLNPLRRGVDGI